MLPISNQTRSLMVPVSSFFQRPRGVAGYLSLGVIAFGALAAHGCLVEVPPVADEPIGPGGSMGNVGGDGSGGSVSGSGGQGGVVVGGSGGSGGGNGCGAGFKRCNGSNECVEATPANGCGSADCQPCQRSGNLETADFACSEAGQCLLASCDLGFADCDGDLSNGCEKEFGDVVADVVPLPVPEVTSGIVVDAEKNDWEDFGQYALRTACAGCNIVGDGTEANVLTPGVPSRRDIDAYFRLAWDDSFLYVFAEAYDDQLATGSPNSPAFMKSPAFAEDSFSVMVDGRNDGMGFGDDDHIVYLTRTQQVAGRNSNPQSGDVVISVGTTGPHCYRVEAGISWTYLVGSNPGSQLPPDVGKKYGFDLFINDWDVPQGTGEAQRESAVFWTDPGDRFWLDPAGFSELELRAAP